MEDDDRQQQPADPEASVLGSLPRGRPGTRSPRRGAAGEVRSRPDDPEPPPRESETHGPEDLAWAGVAVAAEAATLGVRLANRALEAMRGSVERR